MSDSRADSRLLMEEGLELDEAVRIVSQTCAYTNHTILAEALETWPLEYLEQAVPQLVPIIEHLDKRAKALSHDPKTAIIDRDHRVHMAHIDIHYGFSINGVAQLHTEILEKSELSAFYEQYPERFHNETNGITFRRWLMLCNPRLSELIGELIGEGWKQDATRLEQLTAFVQDDTVIDRLLDIKQENKRQLRESCFGPAVLPRPQFSLRHSNQAPPRVQAPADERSVRHLEIF